MRDDDVALAGRWRERVTSHLHALRMMLADTEMHRERLPADIHTLALDAVGQCVNFVEMCIAFADSQRAMSSSSGIHGSPGATSSSRVRGGTTPVKWAPLAAASSPTSMMVAGASPPYARGVATFADTRRPRVAQPRALTPPPSSSFSPRAVAARDASSAHAAFAKRAIVCRAYSPPPEWTVEPQRLSPRQRSSIEGAVRSIVNRAALSDADREWLVSSMRRLRGDDDLSLPY